MERNSSKVLWKETIAKFQRKKLMQSFMEKNSRKNSPKETQTKFYGR